MPRKANRQKKKRTPSAIISSNLILLREFHLTVIHTSLYNTSEEKAAAILPHMSAAVEKRKSRRVGIPLGEARERKKKNRKPGNPQQHLPASSTLGRRGNV